MEQAVTQLGTLTYRAARRAGVAHFEELLLLNHSPASESWRIAPRYRIERLEDLGQFQRDAATPESMLEPAMARRLGDGRNHCFVARKNGTLAGYIWFAQRFIEAVHNRGAAKHSGVAIEFPETMVFLYKAWVLPEHRGQGLFGAMVGCSYNDWAAQGISSILTTTEVINQPVLSVCKKLGFTRLGRCFRIGIGRLYGGVSPHQTASRYGVTFGSRKETQTRCAVQPV